MNTTRST